MQEEVRLAVAFALWRESKKTGRTQRQEQVLFGGDGVRAFGDGETSPADSEAREKVDSLQRELAAEKERSQRLQGELEKQLREKGKARSALEEIRTATGSSLVDENASLKTELRKWKNIARHINIELIEHDKEVLKIMQLTGGTRLAWERDLALNRQGLFASKLNEQERAVQNAVAEAKKELTVRFDEDMAQERKSRERAETELSGLKNKSAYFEEMFRDTHKVNKTLAETHAELLDELERERKESAASTPRKVRQHAEKMRKRNRELHNELEDLRITGYETERQIKDLNHKLEEKERELADQEKHLRKRNADGASVSTQTGAVVFGDAEKMKKEKEKRERMIKAYEQKIEKQASQLEKQRAQADKHKSKTEKKLRKASKFIASLQERQSVRKSFFGWKSEMLKEQSLHEYKKESLERKKQWKSKLVITYFSMYHHKRHDAQLLKHCLLRWKILSKTCYSNWLAILHKALRRIQRVEARTLNARLQLSQGWTVTKALVAQKFPLSTRSEEKRNSGYCTTSSVTLKRLVFAIWKFQAIQKKLLRDRRGLKLAISFLDRQRRDRGMKWMLKGWKKACAPESVPAVTAAHVNQNLNADKEEEKEKEEEERKKEQLGGEASEVTFVDKTLGMKIDSGVIIKYTKDSSALQSILEKVQSILHNELTELQDTISKEVNQMTASRSKSTLSSKLKIQKRLLHVDMTCGKLLEGLLLMQQTLKAGSEGAGQAFQTNFLDVGSAGTSSESASKDLKQVTDDLRAIKAQAHQALTALEGLDRKMAVGHRVIKADLPKRITFLYNKHLQENQDPKEKIQPKAPEWNANLPVFLPIE